MISTTAPIALPSTPVRRKILIAPTLFNLAERRQLRSPPPKAKANSINVRLQSRTCAPPPPPPVHAVPVPSMPANIPTPAVVPQLPTRDTAPKTEAKKSRKTNRGGPRRRNYRLCTEPGYVLIPLSEAQRRPEIVYRTLHFI